MPTNYSGNPTGVHAPSPAPGPGIVPVVVVPLDGEPGTSGSVTEALEVPADHIAFWAFPGRCGHFRERWDIAPATLSATTNPIADLAKRWRFDILAGATQTCAFQDPATATGNYASRSVKLNQGTGNVSQISVLSTAFPVWTPPAAAYRFLLEWDLQPTLSTGTSREWHCGLSSSNTTLGDVAMFYTDYLTNTNWQAEANGTFTDTNISAAQSATWSRFSILIDTVLGTPSMLYYINGTLVATRTNGLPVAGTNYYLQFGGRQVTGGTCAFTVGDVAATWTKF